MPRLFSRVEFARLARVSPAAITKAGKKQLAGAFVADRIDADHPDALAYLSTRGITQADVARGATAPPKDRRRHAPSPARAPTQAKPTARKKKAKPPALPPEPVAPAVPPTPDPPPLPTAPGFEDLDEIERKIQPLLLEFGTSRRVADWLDCVKTIQEIRTKKLANEQTQGKLIERDLVRKVVFSALDSLALKLLRDAPPTLAREIYALAKSGAAIEDAEAKIEDYIEQIFEAVNDTCRKMLNDDAG
jgi:hypothetical protein